MNEMLLARGRGSHAYNRKKKTLEDEIYFLCTEQGITRMERAWFIFEWIERDKRRDKDNIAAGRKFILDGLVKARRLPGDGWNHVIGWIDLFWVDRENPGVRVQMWRHIPEITKEMVDA